MGWSNTQLDTLTLPPYAGPGDARIVIGPDLPPPLDTYTINGTGISSAIIFYGATPSNDDYIWLGLFRFSAVIRLHLGYVLNGSVIEVGSEAPSGQGWDFDGAGTVVHRMSSGLVASVSSAQPYEVWHNLFLQNGWVNFGGAPPQVTAQYRMVPSPANSVQVVGRIALGTTAANTVIANLPAGYRPASAFQFPITNNGGGNVLYGTVTTNGNITLGVATSNDISFNFIIPLDA